MDQSAEQMLTSTPYLIADGRDAQMRFERVASRAGGIRERAIAAAARIAAEARRVLPQFEIAIRSDLVSESDRMEGIPTSAREIRELVQAKRDLLEMDVSAFVQFVRDDERLLDSLGLYRAYGLADEWAHARQRPREFELRGLHSLVMPSLASAGTYKAGPNEIEGSAHKPTAPWDVSREMSELAAWFGQGCGEAALDAAVVHAWITHVHPFDDGNGRMARLLANLALIQAGYPPLLLRSQSDRGEYLDALAASDEGDILPLYDLFVSSLRRVVLTMEKPNYVQSKIRGDLLKTTEQRYEAWLAMATALFGCIQQKTKWTPWGAYEMGYPKFEHFDLLEHRNHDGNCWFVKLRQRGEDRWLLWFGFRSNAAVDLVGEARCWPSIFIAERTDRPDAVHPYETDFDREDVPNEVIISPGSAKPVSLRDGLDIRDVQIDEAAAVLVKVLCEKR